MNEFSYEIWKSTYKYKDEQTLDDSFDRNAKAIASVEESSKISEWEEKFKYIFHNRYICPGGRIIANAGTEYKAFLFNCYTAPTRSYDIDSIEGILENLLIQCLTLRSEGGWGENFSYLRPRGSFINGIGVESPGSVRFMEIFNKSSDILTSGSGKENEKKYNNKIKKGKIRKGAQGAILDNYHPDIEEYISAKRIPNKLDKFNISVAAHNNFMDVVNRVEITGKDENIDLYFPDTTFEKYKEEWDGNLEVWKNKKYPINIYKNISVKYLWNLIMRSTYNFNDPGILFIDRVNETYLANYLHCANKINPCQPCWATVLTPNGISTIGKIKEGDEIWSKSGWTKVIKKYFSGIKDVNAYRTTFGTFYGTKNHKIIENGEKIEVELAEGIDILRGKYDSNIILDEQAIMDGLVIGDGSVHKASNNLVYLCIGKKDQDYFKSEISKLIIKHRSGLSDDAYEIQTDINHTELPLTFNRQVPDRYLYGNKNIVCSFLRGLFSANGSMCDNRVTLKASSFKIIEHVQLMLSSLGIASYYTTNKSSMVKFTNGEYLCKQSYDINITRDREKFYNLIGFIQKYKTEKLISVINKKNTNPENITKNINNIDFISSEEVFDITVDNDTHTYWTGGLDVSNCFEQTMPPGSVCDLGSLVLPNFLIYKEGLTGSNNYQIDLQKLCEVTKIAVRFLDNVNDYSGTPHEKYSIAAKQMRRIGLGVMGWGSFLYLMKIRFGSDKAESIKNQIMLNFTHAAIEASIDLAEEKGSFWGCNKENLIKNKFWDQINLPDNLRKRMAIYGLRNSSLFSIQPTGNTSILMENVSGGCEPIFLHEYIRTIIVQSPPDSIKNLCPNYFQGEFIETDMFKFDREGEEIILRGIDKTTGIIYKIDKNRGLTKEIICEDYAVRKLKELKEWDSMAEWAVTTDNLNVEDHIKDLKGWAKWIDSSISKTVNVPNNYPFEKFKQIYLDAYNSGIIKGITTYRQNTMINVLAPVKKDNRRPKKLPAHIYTTSIKGKKYFVAVGLKENGSPYEIFTGNMDGLQIDTDQGFIQRITKGKYSFLYDNEVIIDNMIEFCNEQEEAMARLLSISLRNNINVKDLVLQLEKSKGVIHDFSKVTARILKRYIQDGSEIDDSSCPICGQKLIRQSGCVSCVGENGCGWSKC